MKLYVKRGKGKFNFLFLLPTFILKYRWTWRLILQNDENATSEDCEKLAQIYREIRSHLKRFGHFTLMELETEEDMKIIIKI